jgi:uncharacterized protein YdiU (UPF0061 family)
MARLLSLLQSAEVDMTLWFRGLADLDPDAPTLDPMAEAFYDPAKRQAHRAGLEDWLREYARRLLEEGGDGILRRSRMEAANPLYVPRNWLLQSAIDRAGAGDPEGILELQDVFARPYTRRPGLGAFAARRPEWARDRAGCSMLSCSS